MSDVCLFFVQGAPVGFYFEIKIGFKGLVIDPSALIYFLTHGASVDLCVLSNYTAFKMAAPWRSPLFFPFPL